MARLDRWVDASLIPEQRTKRKPSPKVDDDIQARIHSLLKSQNEHQHPRAPFSSLEYASSTSNSEEDHGGHSPHRATSHTPSAAKPTAKLVDIGPRNLSRVTDRFDGPAGPIAYPDIDYLQEEPSRPEFKKGDDSNEEILNLEYLSGSSKFGVGSRFGRDHRKSKSSAAISSFRPTSRSVSQSSKKSTKSHILVDNLRTPPPASSNLKATPLKSENQSMPGSYISDIDAAATQSPPITSPIVDIGSVKEISVSNPTQFNPGPNPETHSRAIEALRNARDYDKSVKTSCSKPALRRGLSQTSLRSTNSALNSLHLLKLASGYANTTIQAAEPILTSSVSQGQSYSESFKTPQSILSKYHDIESARSSSAEMGSIEANPSQDLSRYHALSVKHKTSDAVNLPIESLRSLTHKDIDEPYNSFSTAKDTTRPDLESLTDQQPTRRKRTLPLSYEDEKPSVIRPSTFLGTNDVVNSIEIDEATSKAGPTNNVDTDASSAMVQKLSQLRKAVTGLSNTSLFPTLQLPCLQSSVSHKEEDDANGKRNLQEISSSQSKRKNGNSEGSSDKACLVKDLGSEEVARPKKHWIQQLLSRKSSNSLTKTDSNLTARSSRQFKYNTKSRNQKPDTPSSSTKSNANDDALTENEVVDEKARLDEQQRNMEPFTRVIEDLEGLLNEAIILAKRATDPAIGQGSQSTSSYSINHESKLVHNSYNSSIDSDDISSSSGDLDVEQHRTTLPVSYNCLGGDYQDQEKLLKVWGDWSGEDIHAENPKSHSIIRESSIEVHSIPESALQTEHVEDTDDVSKRFETRDWAFVKQPPHEPKPQTFLDKNLTLPRKPGFLMVPLKEQQRFVVRGDKPSSAFAAETVVPQYNPARRPRIQPRSSSAGLRAIQPQNEGFRPPKTLFLDEKFRGVNSTNLQPSGLQYRTETQQTIASSRNRGYSFTPNENQSLEGGLPSLREQPSQQNGLSSHGQGSPVRNFSLTGRRHHSLRETHGFSLSRSHRRAPIARDWRTPRKRYVATVACINTALMGLIIGIYAGEVPAIQYAIVDEHHYTILGNVVFFIGLSITTAFFWPLPLLHGRKPYTITALALLLPLQFPQATAVGTTRSPNVSTYRVGLLLSRSLSGLIIGFANINFMTTLLDLFGASLQSAHPHQETVNNNDVRRHGGGMGVWLGIWTWCFIGSIGVGFLIGAIIISDLDVSWGFWLTIILTAFILILNVLVPEVRRSPYRRSMAEVQNDGAVSRRIARGEIKMHIDATGPIWWWEEAVAGHKLCLRMLKQPGFTVLALYMGWIYGQIVMVIVASTSEFHTSAIADPLPASGGAYIKVLHVSFSICGPLCCCCTTGCFACDTFSKSLTLQSVEKAVPTDRQYDGTRSSYMDVSSC